jgi:YteA family regulatory protein
VNGLQTGQTKVIPSKGGNTSLLSHEQILHLKNQLEEEKKSLEKHFKRNDNFDLENSMFDSITELSMYDNHPADIATELYEREKDIALNENAEKELTNITYALEQMEKGLYGICISCGKEIPYERLEAIPAAVYCKDHVPQKHVSNDRPVEEEFLMPPFGRTDFDGQDNETEFDGEDAWQIVERWGTSNSPAYAEDNQVSDYDELFIESGEQVGYVQAIEGFIVTDMDGGAGEEAEFVNNDAYRNYVDQNEGDRALMESEQPEA